MLKGDAPDDSFDNHGHHMIGHMEVFSALKLQISEGKDLAHKMLSLLRGILNSPALQDTEVLTSGSSYQLSGNTKTLHQIWKESDCLLIMIWREALPSTNSPTHQKNMQESIEGEIVTLKKNYSIKRISLRTVRKA
ncbi:myomegalin-like isoform X2 [Notamacropus eugenii]|uniref:myomegalin-like isoform X2 n=1 Tax=Notamacropus eugenii TaxID=9315 RepID=UPI003B67ECC6